MHSTAIDPLTHRLAGAAWLPSPNCDERPDPADICLLVVHAISLPPDEFGGPYIDDLFLNRLDPAAHPYFAGMGERRVSAHACVFRDGSVHQYVACDRRAWHAGESSYAGRSRCNDFSIGLELEGCDRQPFEDPQYTALAAIGRALLQAYPRLSPARMVGHSDIAPRRKTDPGPYFDWPRFHQGLGAGVVKPA